jgi:endoglucanase
MKIKLFSVMVFLFAVTMARPQEFSVRKGTNISHWLSQSNKRGEERKSYFTKKDVEFLAGTGFDHIRIPIDEEQMWNEQGQKDPEAFQLLHNALEWCDAFNLKAIVDLHILRSHYFNAKEKPLFTDPKARERFYQCWNDLSDELKKLPVSKVAYELMNEPVADNPEDWNNLVKESVIRLRKLEPQRVIVIGSNKWQSAETFDQLYVPANDKNIILSFHFYSPMLLTHYKAGWVTTGKYTGPVNYPGVLVSPKDLELLDEDLRKEVINSDREFVKTDIEKIIRKPLAIARKYNLPLYCGEWGCYEEAPRTSRLQWYRDVVEVFSKNNIAWTTWDYRGGFGIRDDQRTNDEELIRILVKK